MRKTFVGYYRPTEAEFRRLWDKCIFVLDANVLLNLYRYSEETRSKLIDILQRIQDRLWVPHQAALEYQRNRLEVISAQKEAYAQIEQLLVDTQKKLDTQLKTYKRHPLISAEKVLTSINTAFMKQVDGLREIRQRHPDLVDKDDVREILTKLLTGKVGSSYPEERLNQIYREGEARFAKAIAPGYKDAKSKDGERAFGDLVMWYQVIDKAAADKVPVIIVTDDLKEDWWWRHEGKIVGPKPELVEEIHTKAGVGFYMYVSDKFMEYARDYLKQHVDQEAIDEIRELRTLDEQRRHHREKMLIHKERQLNELRHELVSLDSESVHLRAEIALLTQQLTAMTSEPADARSPDERYKLISSLSMRIGELEGRCHILEKRRQEMSIRLHLEQEERDSVVHGTRERYRLVRTTDGTMRKVVVRDSRLERSIAEGIRGVALQRKEDSKEGS